MCMLERPCHTVAQLAAHFEVTRYSNSWLGLNHLARPEHSLHMQSWLQLAMFQNSGSSLNCCSRDIIMAHVCLTARQKGDGHHDGVHYIREPYGSLKVSDSHDDHD